jgi:putative copper resistance protein D
VDELIIVSRAVHFAALALLFGAPFFRLAISPLDPARGWPGGRGIELAAALAVLVSGAGWFAGVAATFAGGWSEALAPDILGAVTFETRFGHLWLARLAVLAALLAIQLTARLSRRRDGALVCLAATLTASLIGVGHGMTGAGGGPAVARLHMAADVIHLLCAMGWIGGLFCLVQMLRQAMAGDLDAEAMAVAVQRFSRVGYWLVALLLVSGCINALVLVPRPDSLVTSDYGRVLMVKLGLVLIMAGFAIYNRVALAARALPSKGGTQALWRSAVAEQGVGLLVLASVAWLGTIHPVP